MTAVAENFPPPSGRFERTTPFLRPNQIKELADERRGLSETLAAPAYIRNQVQDASAMHKRIRSIDQQLARDTATPYPQDQVDAAVKREHELREAFVETMPTQAEMRRSPAGAIDKHRNWERINKTNILEWKNIRLRLHAGGQDDRHPDAREVANIEHFRPVTARHELNMDNTLVQAKDIFLPPGTPAIHNVMEPEAAEAATKEKEIIARLLDENPKTTIAEFRDLMRAEGLDVPDGEPATQSTKPATKGKQGAKSQ